MNGKDPGYNLVMREFLAENPGMKDLRRYALRLAECMDPLFITGETGTGKTLLARLIHKAGNRKGPFYILLENRSPFSSVDGVSGRSEIEKAEGGTLCIQGPGELNDPDQRNLLRYLETGCLRLPGWENEKKPNVRIIFESRLSLDSLLKIGRLRLDLYYHLKAHEIVIPPLHDRPEDIVPLAKYFLLQARGPDGNKGLELSKKVEAALLKQHYPENVEALRGRIFRVAMRDPEHEPSAGLFHRR